jgi:uncharacterized membrane protein
MTLAPLLDAPFIVQVHAFSALALIPVTALQFVRRKGGAWHRRLGWTWVALMAATALSSFGIHHIRMVGPFSPIHILSIASLVALAAAIIARRQGDIARHRRIMIINSLAWATAGAFTLLPGRIMLRVVMG